jgi:hypothetical protein
MKSKARSTKPARPAMPDAARHYATFKSPIGDLLIVASDTALTGLYFAGRDHVPSVSHGWRMSRQHPVLQRAMKQLEQYFAGKRSDFDIPMNLDGTHFQEKVWREIPSPSSFPAIGSSEKTGRSAASLADWRPSATC